VVVFGEVAGLGPAHAEDLLESSRRVVRDVLVERPWQGAGLEDALDSAVLERAEARGVGERCVDVLRVEAAAQEEDLPRVVGQIGRASCRERV